MIKPSPLKYTKVINFDLNTISLEKKFGSSYRSKYTQLSNTLKQLGFNHEQGSTYKTNDRVSNIEFWKRMDTLFEKHEWLKQHASEIMMSNIIGEFDVKQRYISSEELKTF